MQTANLKIETIKPADILLSGFNPRQVNTQAESFKELVASVKINGVKVPIMVRPHPAKKDKFELLAGNRRLLAAQAVKAEKINCMVHTNITDEQAFDITFFENFLREDLTPLEEGKAATIMLEKYKGDVKAAASKFGKGIQWLMQRAAIDNKLCKAVKNEISKATQGDSLFLWTASHLQLIAGLPDELQECIIDDFDCEEVPTIKELTNHIQQLMRPLSKTPWNFEQVDEITIGQSKVKVCCSKCTKRTSAQPGLFDNTLDKEQLRKNDRCLAAGCWRRRMTKSLSQKADVLRKENPKLVIVAEGIERWDGDGSDLRESFGDKVIFKREYKDSTKKDKKAIPALVLNGQSVGLVKYIKLNTSSSTSSSAASSTKAEPKKSLKEKQKELENKRWFSVLHQMKEALEKTTIEKIKPQKGKDKIFEAVKLAVYLGTDNSEIMTMHKRYYSDVKDIMSKYRSQYQGENLAGLAALLFKAVIPKLIEELSYNGPFTQMPDSYAKTAKAVAELMGFDIDAMLKKACIEYPVPKS